MPEANPIEMSDEDFLAQQQDGGGYFESDGDSPGDSSVTANSGAGDDTSSNTAGGFHEVEADGTQAAPEEVVEPESTDAGTDATVTELTPQEQLDIIYGSFKANGTDMSITDPNQVVTLMQKGVGFDAKARELAPQRKVIETLRKNDLLEGDTLNLLIEANNKNPDAIAKLLKDADVDPLYLDMEGKEDYTPKDYSVSDQDVALAGVIEEIKSSATYEDTMRTITEDWDVPSQDLLVSTPAIISAIDQHKSSGVYDQIDSRVKKAIAVGEIPPDTPYLEAYQYMGNVMEKAGDFQDTEAPATPSTTAAPVEATVSQAGDQATQQQARDQRSAAAGTKSASTTGANNNDAPLEMSDEDFLKKYAGTL